MEHIIELKKEVAEQLMKRHYGDVSNLRAPFSKFTLKFTNSIFVDTNKVMEDVLNTMKKEKGVTLDQLPKSEVKKLESMAEKYANGTCTMKVTCFGEDEALQFRAKLVDPMGSPLMRFTYSYLTLIPFVEENNFSSTPLVTANALNNLIIGIIEYLNAPSKILDRKEVKELAPSKGNKKKGKKNKNKKTYIYKYYYSVDNVNIGNNNKRTYERHTESWTSRGHWRTYKSGKKVWIKEQVKGRGRDKALTKEYKINKLDK